MRYQPFEEAHLRILILIPGETFLRLFYSNMLSNTYQRDKERFIIRDLTTEKKFSA